MDGRTLDGIHGVDGCTCTEDYPLHLYGRWLEQFFEGLRRHFEGR